MAKEEKNNRLKAEYRSIESRFHRQLTISLARPKLEVAFFVAWAILDVILILVFVFKVVMFIVNGAFADTRQVATLLDNAASTQAGADLSAPLPISLAEIKTASLELGHYDVFAEITNHNSDWYATFDYVFTYSGGATTGLPGFVNPNETKTLAAINLDLKSRPTSLGLSFENFIWHRIDRQAIPDVDTYLEERNNITLESATYTTDIVVGDENLARSSLTLRNHTAYSYWEPEFLVKLMRGSSLVSLTTVTVPEFEAGETRVVEVRWLGNLPATATVAVEPSIPFFETSIYMRPSGE